MDDQRGKKTEDRFYDRLAVRSGRSLLLALFLIARLPDLHFHLINVDTGQQPSSLVLILYQSRAEFPNLLLFVFVDVFYLFSLIKKPNYRVYPEPLPGYLSYKDSMLIHTLLHQMPVFGFRCIFWSI